MTLTATQPVRFLPKPPKGSGSRIAAGAKVGDLQEIANGKIKCVYMRVIADAAGHLALQKSEVFYKVSRSGQKEMTGEIRKAREIQENLSGRRADSSSSEDLSDTESTTPSEESFVATNLTQRPDGLVRALGAEGDLDGYVRKDLPFDTRLDLGDHVVRGMHNLQRAGFVSGDAKLENVLVFIDEQGNPIARISDFGKARKLAEGKVSLADGNPRFVAPEGFTSREGEIFSTGLMILRVLEEGLRPDLADDLETKNRRGVEGLLLLEGRANKKGVLDLLAIVVNYIFARLFGHVSIDTTEEKVIHAHIDTVFDEHAFNMTLIGGGDGHSLAKLGGLRLMKALLKDMTSADPTKRPSMEAVEKRYTAAMSLMKGIE